MTRRETVIQFRYQVSHCNTSILRNKRRLPFQTKHITLLFDRMGPAVIHQNVTYDISLVYVTAMRCVCLSNRIYTHFSHTKPAKLLHI